MWELDHKEGWASKNWCSRTVVLELWRRLFRVPWTAWRSNQSILKEISPEYSLEGLMLKLKLHYFGHLSQRADSLEKTLMLGKIEGSRRRGWQGEMTGWYHWLNGHEFEQAPGDGEGQSGLVCCSQTRLSNWATTTSSIQWNHISSLNSVPGRNIDTMETGQYYKSGLLFSL